jgi:transcription elongation GreA/GreB family factor
MQKQYKMTMEHLVSLHAELDYIKTVREQEVAEQIKIARGFGDLSENSEYDEAKNEQGKVGSRKAELEDIIPNAVVTDFGAERLDELKKELEEQKATGEPAAAAKAAALDKLRRPDDPAAESDYNDAKAEHDKICSRIRALEFAIPEFENRIRSGAVEHTASEKGVGIGARVRISFLGGYKFAGKGELEFTLVGSQEASMKDMANLRLSDESPIGKALMGAHVGSTVTIEAPAATFQCKVQEISR